MAGGTWQNLGIDPCSFDGVRLSAHSWPLEDLAARPLFRRGLSRVVWVALAWSGAPSASKGIGVVGRVDRFQLAPGHRRVHPRMAVVGRFSERRDGFPILVVGGSDSGFSGCVLSRIVAVEE